VERQSSVCCPPDRFLRFCEFAMKDACHAPNKISLKSSV
jgi:hypothetical protein